MLPHERLAAAVILQALEDATRKGREGVRARAWLSKDSDGLAFWAAILELSPKEVRKALGGVLAGEVEVRDGRQRSGRKPTPVFGNNSTVVVESDGN